MWGFMHFLLSLFHFSFPIFVPDPTTTNLFSLSCNLSFQDLEDLEVTNNAYDYDC